VLVSLCLCGVLVLLGASPLDPSRGLSRCALWLSFTFSRLHHCQFRARAADWALQADTGDHALQPAAVGRPPQQRDSWPRQRQRHSRTHSDLNSSTIWTRCRVEAHEKMASMSDRADKDVQQRDSWPRQRHGHSLTH